MVHGQVASLVAIMLCFVATWQHYNALSGSLAVVPALTQTFVSEVTGLDPCPSLALEHG